MTDILDLQIASPTFGGSTGLANCLFPYLGKVIPLLSFSNETKIII